MTILTCQFAITYEILSHQIRLIKYYVLYLNKKVLGNTCFCRIHPKSTAPATHSLLVRLAGYGLTALFLPLVNKWPWLNRKCSYMSLN